MRNFPRSSPPSFIQGCFHEEPTDLTGITWSALVNQLVNSATDTETTDDMLGEMLPEGRYWRFNPRIGVEPIDEAGQSADGGSLVPGRGALLRVAADRENGGRERRHCL